MSKKFTTAQRNYRVWEYEMLAILQAHKALEFFKTTKHLSSRQARWMEYLSRFSYTIEYVQGIENLVADALSRYYHSDNLESI